MWPVHATRSTDGTAQFGIAEEPGSERVSNLSVLGKEYVGL
jgi:hypothetical protein